MDESASRSADKLPISPSLEEMNLGISPPPEQLLIDRRVLWVASIAVAIGFVASLVAVVLMKLIAVITNISFYGRLSFDLIGPEHNQLGLWVIPIPIVGAVLIGLMARYGSKAIRGHGIPEAMEQVLTNRSRIPARVTWLKPLSSAISIGTGGPFGAEGPIIATGGALGSMVGQMLHTSPSERKTLLAVGAASGMAATFGSPVSAVLLAIELLLFEFRPRSMIPVALGAVTATGMRALLEGSEPVFPMPDILPATLGALLFYVALGAFMGLIATGITWFVYAIEDTFEKLPIHWMWWPAIGAVAVGLVGYFAPRTLGVGYDNITAIISGQWGVGAVLFLCFMKLISWSISLGSGTSGGTLAPMFTIGGGIGYGVGALAAYLLPFASIDPRTAALVGMAAIFAGASRALLASAVFAFETTLQPAGIVPLLGGCAMSYLIATMIGKQSIMTEKIARRGIRTPTEYRADPLAQVLVRDISTKDVVTLAVSSTVGSVRRWLETKLPDSSHQGFPVVNDRGHLVGVVTRRELNRVDIQPEMSINALLDKPLRYVFDDTTARQAADHMLNHDIGRLPVLDRESKRLVGIVTRSDILAGYRHRLEEEVTETPTLPLMVSSRS